MKIFFKKTFALFLFFNVFFSKIYSSDFSQFFEIPDFMISILNDDSVKNKTDFLPEKIIELSLVFSGLENSSLIYSQCREIYFSFLKKMRSKEITELPPEIRGNVILENIHETFFKNYLFTQTRTDVILQNGNYNCVSSGILYLAAAKAAGLKVYGIGTTNHAFCVVYSEKDGRYFDVETTNIYGFNPGSKREFYDSFGKTTGFAYVQPKNYRIRETLSERAFLSLILANRFAELSNQKKYSQAIFLARARYEFLACVNDSLSESAKNDLILLYDNAIKTMQNQGEFSSSMNFYEEVCSYFGMNDVLKSSLYNNLHNVIANELNHQNINSAEEYFKKWNQYLTKNQYSRIQKMIEDSKKQRIEISYINQAEILAKQNSYLEAAKIIDEGISKIGSTRNFQNAKRAYIQNYAVTVHNRCVPLINAGNYEEAKKILQDALKNVPENSTLKNDLRILERY